MRWRNLSPLWIVRLLIVGGLVAGAMRAAYESESYRGGQPVRNATPVPAVSSEVAPVPHEKPPDVKRVMTADEAVRIILADAERIPPGDRCFMRYVWNQSGERKSVRTVSLAANYAGRGTVVLMPAPLANFHLVRIDLRHYWPRYDDLKEASCLWEEFAYDPAFSLLITRGTLDLLVRTGYAPVAKLAYYRVRLKGIDVLRENAPHIEAAPYCRLQELLGTQAPVVEHRYWKSRILSTIKGKGVFKTVFGGLYYEFRGIRKAKAVLGADTKATDLDLYFESLGIGNIRGGLTAEKLFDGLRSDQRMAMFRSDVTGKPREVSSFHTPATRETIPWGAITGDVADDDIDIDQRSYANLLKPFRKAREGIFPRANGTRDFTLFNGDGALQDEVPFDIANAHNHPFPHTKRLQAAIDCLICHEADGSDGWKPIRNDVRTLLRSRNGPDILTDFDGLRAFKDDQYGVIDRIAGLFAGDFSTNLRRAREDVSTTRLRITGPWEDGGDQTGVVRLSGQRLADEYAEYNWALVDARTSLYEMGLDVPKAKATEFFALLIPPDIERSRAGDFVYEDPRIAALRAGLEINRSDWALSYAYAAERFKRGLAKQQLLGGVQWWQRFVRN